MVRGWSIVPGGLNCQIPPGLSIQSLQKQMVMSRESASRGENFSFCRYCKKYGHIDDRFRLANKHFDNNKRIFHAIANMTTKVTCKYSRDKLSLSPFSMAECVTPSFRPFCSTGFLSADESCKSSSPINILRDSAPDMSLVLKEAVPNPDCYIGEMVIISGLIGSMGIPICKT